MKEKHDIEWSLPPTKLDSDAIVDEPPGNSRFISDRFQMFIDLSIITPKWAHIGQMPCDDARLFERRLRQSMKYWARMYAPWLRARFRFRTFDHTPPGMYDVYVSLQEIDEVKAREECRLAGFDYDTRTPVGGWDSWEDVLKERRTEEDRQDYERKNRIRKAFGTSSTPKEAINE